MPKLFKVNTSKYVWLTDKGVSYEGDECDVMHHMIKVGVAPKEAMLGMDALEYDDVADYGINRMFIFSKKIKITA